MTVYWKHNRWPRYDEEQIVRTRYHYWVGEILRGIGPFKKFEDAELAWLLKFGHTMKGD